jgi:hypothetical protein
MRRTIPLLKAVLIHESDEAIWSSVYTAVTETTPPPRPLPPAQTPWKQTTTSIMNSSGFTHDMDPILKRELELLCINVPGLFEQFFETVLHPYLQEVEAVCFKCLEGDDPLYTQNGWRDWPTADPDQDRVLAFLQSLASQLKDFAEQNDLPINARRRLVATADQPLTGTTPKRKPDIVFIDHPSVHQTPSWSDVLICGELKKNPNADIPSGAFQSLLREVHAVFATQDNRRFVLGFTICGSLMRVWEFDRLGGIASAIFDIQTKESWYKLVYAMLSILIMSEEQLGFDPTIIKVDGKRCIDIKRNGQQERLIIDEMVKHAPCIAGRATTCWKAHLEGGDSRFHLVIKDSWQYPERQEEGEMIREATDKGVENVARYYHHETVAVGDRDDDIQSNVRGGLDTSTGVPKELDISARTGQKSTTSIGQKRSSAHLDDYEVPYREICSKIQARNRMHRRVIVRDYGKSIYKASTRVALLAAIEGCIHGYQSLHEKAGILQRDISINNLMMNEEEDNPSWKSFLIDLDLAIKEQREGPSGADGKTGTRVFMAIGVLLGEEHSYMHDLESFFWVLFWICIHYNGPNQEARVVQRFETWNYGVTEHLAEAKMGLVSRERHFRNVAQEYFSPYYQPLEPWVNRLRRVVFPGGQARENQDPSLYSAMKKVLHEAREELAK